MNEIEQETVGIDLDILITTLNIAVEALESLSNKLKEGDYVIAKRKKPEDNRVGKSDHPDLWQG